MTEFENLTMHRIELKPSDFAKVALPNGKIMSLTELPVAPYLREHGTVANLVSVQIENLLKAMPDATDAYILTRRYGTGDVISFAVALYGGEYVSKVDKKLHNEVMMQLFLNGPVWDGNIISKTERDALYDAGLITRKDGWQWLNEKGVAEALSADVSKWVDNRWHKKQKMLR